MARDAAGALEDLFPGRRVALQIERREVLARPGRRLLGDRADHRLRCRRDLLAAAPGRDERHHRQKERESCERAAHRGQSNQVRSRTARRPVLETTDDEGRDGAEADDVAGRVVDDEGDEQGDEHRVGERAPRPSCGDDGEDDERRADGECRADRGECPPGRQLEPVGDVTQNGTRSFAHGVRDVTRPARDGVEPYEDDRRRDGRDGNRRCPTRVETDATPADEERCVRRQEHEQPAAVRAEAAPRDRDQGDPCDRRPGAAEKRRSEDRRDEEHRLQQVGDAVEAPCLRGAERGQRDGLGVEAEDQQVGGQDGGAGEPERQDHRRRGDERDEPPAGEPEVRGQPEQDDPRCETRRDAPPRCRPAHRRAASGGAGCGRSSRSGARAGTGWRRGRGRRRPRACRARRRRATRARRPASSST